MFFSLSLSAQRMPGAPPASHQQKEDRIKSHKIAYLTEQLSLSPEEAQQFWPVYNAYANEEIYLFQVLHVK